MAQAVSRRLLTAEARGSLPGSFSFCPQASDVGKAHVFVPVTVVT
jgi:hypothetical protein